jgi:CRP-like cAMP-binding protein
MHALELLNELQSEDIDWLFDRGVEDQVIANTLITQEGKANDALYLVLEGLLAVRLQDFGDKCITTLGPGEIVGEMQFLTGQVASATVTAAENSLLLILKKSDINIRLDDDPAFSARLYHAFAKTLAERLKDSNARLIQTASERVSEQSSGTGLWDKIEPHIAGFKKLMQKSDQEMIKNFGELSAETADRIRSSFRSFSLFLNQTLGDTSGTNPLIKEKLGGRVQQEMLPYILLSEMGERIYSKPRGYAGDYYTIELMYRNQPSGSGRLGTILDECFYQEPACQAVQNRRSLLANEIQKTLQANLEKTSRVTSMASGPASEMFDVFKKLDDKTQLLMHCIDIDLHALAFVGDKRDRERLKGQINLHNGNLVYLATGRQKLEIPPQDLVYSIGLIDYFNDRFVVKLLNYIHSLLQLGGRVILGNFHPHNSSKALMDYVFDWKLIHRDEADMNRLFEQSMFGKQATNIRYETEGVNLFAECVK